MRCAIQIDVLSFLPWHGLPARRPSPIQVVTQCRLTMLMEANARLTTTLRHHPGLHFTLNKVLCEYHVKRRDFAVTAVAFWTRTNAVLRVDFTGQLAAISVPITACPSRNNLIDLALRTVHWFTAIGVRTVCVGRGDGDAASRVGKQYFSGNRYFFVQKSAVKKIKIIVVVFSTF